MFITIGGESEIEFEILDGADGLPELQKVKDCSIYFREKKSSIGINLAYYRDENGIMLIDQMANHFYNELLEMAKIMAESERVEAEIARREP